MRKEATKSVQKVKRSRTRSGCFTCRDRHMKCDEQLPVCQNCINSKRRCYRGIRLNFSLYNYYDPKSTGASADIFLPSHHRILDQSIAVSKLYKNGYQGYKPYRHLHVSKDLTEAERVLHNDLQLNQNNSQNTEVIPKTITEPDIIMQSEELSQFFDTWLYNGQNTDQKTSQVTNNKIRENLDIKRILMNPEIHDKQLGGVMRAAFNQKLPLPPDCQSPRKDLFTATTAPELYMRPQDADGFISLILKQKYFWVLDLFNDLRIWESCIPSYCVRLYQASEIPDLKPGYDEKFLFHCLLLCDERTTVDRILEMCQLQVHRWEEFDKKDVVFSTYHSFEKILISLVLILLAILIHTTRPGFKMDSNIVRILANQGRLIHKLTARFTRIPSPTIKRLSGFTFTIAAFQAITIIRFLLKMRFRKLNIQYQDRVSNEKFVLLQSPDLVISYALADDYDMAEFFTLTEMEVSHLCDDYNGFDHVSVKKKSDARKLRVQFWELILRDYQAKPEEPESASDPESRPQSREDTNLSHTSLIPNSRCLALNIIDAYAKNLWGNSETHKKSSKTLVDIFQKIRCSAMPAEIKAKWVLYFDWSSTA